MTKMHKLVVYFIDMNDEGTTMGDIAMELEQIDIGLLKVFPQGTANIGQFDDDHELNKRSSSLMTHDKYFK